MKVLTVVGARPQFIKAATLSRALLRAGFDEQLLHTGQHYDSSMSGVFFEELEIPRPAHALGIGSASHGAQTGRMLEAIERVLQAERPDWVVVFGDTNSTLAGALAAAKLHIPLAHVEAGLRSYNRRMPEELNRVLTDHASDLLFAPTSAARANLLKEGLAEDRISVVGDVMYDASLYYAAKGGGIPEHLDAQGLCAGAYALATVHRAENTDEPARLKLILDVLDDFAGQLPVVLPLHPRTAVALGDRARTDYPRIRFIDPVGYLDMLALEKHARLVITDSGGVQKEAYFVGVQCVTLRDETEWVELVEAGWNRLAPPHEPLAMRAALEQALAAPAGREIQLYGDGTAAEKIVSALGGR
ncbi:MAG: UDP-N-acetylglucosamine 2-epimerase (non-hydrolyzing) [Myxococcales bacterium]|nr:UDP-N-acetylglucosamine 2-epimerase (non-hydrolyzing) [Myxococcales bacterium]